MEDLAKMDDPYRREGGHLNEMELAMLQSGAAPVSLRDNLVAHLAGCENCAQRVAAIRHLEAGDPNDRSNSEAGNELPARVRLVLLGAFRNSMMSPKTPSRLERIVLALRTPAAWLHEPDEPTSATLAWAAGAPSPGMEEELPVLTTEDGRIRVRFRRPGGEAPLRAYLLAPDDWPVGGFSLQVPSRQLSFRIGLDGTVDLPGIDAGDLEAGILELRLEPEEPAEPDQ